MTKPDPNSFSSIAKRVGCTRAYVSRVARGIWKAGDTPKGRKIARILASRRVVAAGN